MNKNLKKVISAVAALAMTASTFVAFAANYPDVDASASYKPAVDELSALNVINGYEDGTFQPDKLVNRAEFAKMVITALGKAELAQAEAAANQNTKFADVKADHWAAGYVSAATAVKLINGMGDGTFAPDANITYAQAMKMLVCAAGYEQWSVDKGGWPTGYMFYGNQLDIGKGVKDVVQDTEITRAQCAQMIDNALNAPVCVETGKMTFDMYGRQYPELQPKDGYGINFQSILTKKHDAYKVKGMVTGTHRSGDNNKSDEVSFNITSARNWNDEEDQISKKNENQTPISALIGDSEADKFLHKYVEALIAIDDDDEYTILSITEAGKNDDVTIAAADYDEDYKGGAFVDEKMYVLKNGKSSSYKIDTDAKMYVNGVVVGDYTTENVEKYIIGNNVGDVTLIDTPGETNVLDGKYDYVMVDSYLTAVVDSVNVIDEDNIEISFLDSDDEISSQLNPWTIDFTDEDVVYSFESDDENFDVATLGQFDVLSIQANPNDVSDSAFYDVKVSKASTAVEGQVKSYDPDDKEYVVNGTSYKTTAKVEDLVAGDSYTLYLDVFGRIAYTDELASEKKIAILDSAYKDPSGDGKAKLILPDGTTAEYVIKEKKIDDKTTTVDKAIEIVKNDEGEKTPVEDRVVEYSLSNNELVIKNVLTKKGGDDLEYRAAQERIGKYIINGEATSFIYAESDKSADITAMDMSTLIDGNYYEAYFYDMSSSSSIYRFAIIKTGAGQLTADSSMAVVKKYVAMTDEKKGETVDALVLMIDGEEKTVMADDSVDVSGYVEGDAILYGTNAEGYITRIVNLVKGFDLTDGYADLFDAAMVAEADLVNAEDVEKLPETKKGAASLVFGPIVEKTTSSITIGALEATDDGLVTDKTEGAITYASKVNYYTYNYNQPAKSRVAALNNSSAVSAISIPNGAYVDKSEKAAFYWNGISELTNPRFALVKMVDEEATDVYVIIPKNGTKIDKSNLSQAQ